MQVTSSEGGGGSLGPRCKIPQEGARWNGFGELMKEGRRLVRALTVKPVGNYRVVGTAVCGIGLGRFSKGARAFALAAPPI